MQITIKSNRTCHQIVFVALLLLLFASQSGVAKARQLQDKPKQEIPAEKEYRETLARIKQAFAEDLRDTSKVARLALAQKLVEVAQDEANLNVRFVLLDQAAKTAAGAGAIETAWKITKNIDQHFQIELLASVLDQINVSLKAMRNAQELANAVPTFFDIIELTNRLERFEVSTEVIEKVKKVARRSRNVLLIDQLDQKRKEVTELKKLKDNFRKAQAKLKSNPDNGKSLFVAGNYFCFIKDDFDKGLSLLQKIDSGSSQSFSVITKAAFAQLQMDDSPERLGTAGQLWLNASKGDGSLIGQRQRLHAFLLLSRAVEAADGLLKLDLEKQLNIARSAISTEKGVSLSVETLQYICSTRWNVTLGGSVMNGLRFHANGTLSFQNAEQFGKVIKWRVSDGTLALGDRNSNVRHAMVFKPSNGNLIAVRVDTKTGRVVQTAVCKVAK